MMVLPDCSIETPRSIEEAVRLLHELKGAVPLAGGTGLVPALKLGLLKPACLVNLQRIPDWHQVDCSGAGIYLGPGARLADVAAHPRIRAELPVLAAAAEAVGSPQLRNQGTVGGNLCLNTRCTFYDRTAWWRSAAQPCLKQGGDVCLAVPRSRRCHAVFAADTPPALVALGARVRLARWDGARVVERETALADIYRDDGVSWLALEAGELITRVVIPPHVSPGRRWSGFLKFRLRQSIDFPLASVSAVMRMADGIMKDVRVVLGGVASAPVVAWSAMEELVGRELTEEVAARVAQAAARAAHPVPNQAGTPGQRRLMVEVMTERLLQESAAELRAVSAPGSQGA